MQTGSIKQMKKIGKINSIIAIVLMIGLLLQMFQLTALAAVPEKNVVQPGENNYVHLTHYTEHIEDNIFKVSMTMQPLVKSNGGDFIMLIDANENMLQQKIDGKTYFEHALDSAYSASRILLDPTYNPLEAIGANQNRVWIVFYNGQAYNTDGAPLITGTTSTAFCFISDAMERSPSSRAYSGVMPPNSQIKPFGDMQKVLGQIKTNTAPLGSQTGLFNNDVKADQERYTAVGLAAAYDIFADFSGKGVASETNRKIVMLLSNGPDYERDDPLAIDSSLVPAEGSMRMEALFMAKALKFQSHAYDPASTDTGFGKSVEGDLKTAAQSIASSSGNTYFKNLPAENLTAAMPQYVPYGNGLPLPKNDILSESVISLDTHKISIGHLFHQSSTTPNRPFEPIYFLGTDPVWSDPFAMTGINAIPTMSSDPPPISSNFQYEMFGNISPAPPAGQDLLSPLNTEWIDSSNHALGKQPRPGFLSDHGRLDSGSFDLGRANQYSLDSYMYTYADNKLALKKTYDRIASEGGMSAEIWSIGLFVGNDSNNKNPGTDMTLLTPSYTEMISIGRGMGARDGDTTTRWPQGPAYRTDFTGYSSAEHVLRTSSTYGGTTWKAYDLLNPDFTRGTSPTFPYTISYIPKTQANVNPVLQAPTGTGGTGSKHISPAMGGDPPSSLGVPPISEWNYKVNTGTRPTLPTWFTTLEFGGPRLSGTAAHSTGGPSTQNDQTSGSITGINPLPYTVGWRTAQATIPSPLRVTAQEVPRYNGVNFAERDNLYQHLKAVSTVQTSVLKDGAGFDPAKPWVNSLRLWSARQGYLTTRQSREINLITNATINGPTSANVVINAPEGVNSFNQDFENYYESFKANLFPVAYYTAIEQTLATDRETHPLSSQTKKYDAEDFVPIVKMIEGPSLIANTSGETYNTLVQTFEDLVYNYYKISDNSAAYSQISDYFDIIKYENRKEEFELFYQISDKFPSRLTRDLSSVSRDGKNITWKFDKPMYSGITYGLTFYVKMDTTKADNPNMYYPIHNYAYVDLNLKMLTRDNNDNLIRWQIIKNFPANYIQPKNKTVPVAFTLNDHNELITEGGQIIGVFPSGVGSTGPISLDNLPLPFYTPSVTMTPKPTAQPKTLKDENVDEGAEEVPATGYQQFIIIIMCASAVVAALVIYRKNHSIQK